MTRDARSGGESRCQGESGLRQTFGPIQVQRTPRALPMTQRMSEVCLRFGLSPQPGPLRIAEDLSLTIAPGQIVLLQGPSGVGKSSVLREVADRVEGRAVDVARTRMPSGKSLIDLVGARRPLSERLAILTACGVGEPRLWLRQYADLSDGERFRARLARAFGRVSHTEPTALLCDEFCALLHRRAAKAIAFNLRKLMTRWGQDSDGQAAPVLMAACAQDDLVRDLQPDVTLRLLGGGQYRVEHHEPKRRPISFFHRLHIEPGRKRDYDAFRPMHYRCTDELGFVDKVFVLRDGVGGEALGLVVYAHGPMELSLRNKATNRRFVRNPTRLNRELRILRRLVIHPDVRGCGLGRYLVAKTLPRVGVPYVECLANMGVVNPVFERAGMARIGECPVPRGRAKVRAELVRLGVDPWADDLADQVSRRAPVRRVVHDVVFEWLRATTGGGEQRVARWGAGALALAFRQLIGSRPVYYLWQR